MQTKKVDTPEKFSERLLRLRTAMGISQRAMAEALHVSRNYLNMLEGGREPGAALAANFVRLESEFYQREKLTSIVREEPPTEDDSWMRRAIVAEAEVQRLRHKIDALQDLLLISTPSPQALPERREVTYTMPPKKSRGAR